MPLPKHPHRFRLGRAGIHQVWQYDEEFHFGGGRLLLRGKNGAGKSKALEMLLPFLLDGDTRKIDAAGGGKTTLKWLMLDGWTTGTNRLGYLWVEFSRETEDGERESLTLGVAIKASSSTGEAKPVFFVTRLTVGEELPLHDPERRPQLDRLRELVGQENCYDRAADYRARVARELFGMADLARYRNLVHLLYGLRRPTIGDRIESGELVKVLSDALPPLDDEVLDRVARNLDDLDTVRDELARLEKTDAALTTFLTGYRGYLRGVLRGRVGQVRAALEELRTRRRRAGDAERDLTAHKEVEEETAAKVATLEEYRETADTELRTLRESAVYGALQDLRERRATLQAVEGTARAAWNTAELARQGETTAIGRLSDEAEEIGRELTDLRRVLRNASRTARGCGIDEALLGEPPTAQATVLAAPVTETLTDIDGEIREIARPVVRALDAAATPGLTSWRERLGEADQVVKARQRAADALRTRLREVARAERTAETRRQEAEQLDGQLTNAQQREQARYTELVTASAGFAGQVRAWAARLPERSQLITLVEVSTDEDLPAAERALARDTPEAVARVAHEIADPVLDAYDSERDEALAKERAVAGELKAVRAEKADRERQVDPEPHRSPYSTAERSSDAGAPLFLLVDFSQASDEAGLEAALEASGLLNAWVCADGALLAEGTREVLLRGGDPVPGRSLAEVLRPVPGHGVGHAALDLLLRGIGLGESAAHSWVADDGRWRLGVASGSYGKQQAEYIGAGVRAATRQRRIDELTGRIGELEAMLTAATTTRTRIEEHRDALRHALREVPAGWELISAWVLCDGASAETARLTAELADARRAAEKALATAVRLRTQAHTQATADELPTDPDGLSKLQTELHGLRDGIGALGRDAGRLLTRLDTHARTRGSWTGARDTRATAERDYGAAYAHLITVRRELSLLEESVGATEQEILAKETAAEHRRADADRQLPQAKSGHQKARDDRVKAGVEREAAATALIGQEQAVVSGGDGLRRPLGLPGLPLAAELGDLDSALEAYDTAQDDDVRARITALRTLSDDIEGRLGPASGDVSDSLILRRGEELRDGLSGGYDAAVDETDGIKRFALHDDTGAHDVAVVGQRIRTAALDARNQLSAREQEVFERYLLGELGDHLSRQVLAAQTLVKEMNDTLEEVRSSHGIGARLHWELPAGSDADITAAVSLLRRPAALRSREQSAQLREALRRRIEEARLADPSAGYALHLRTALDYRAWFMFKVKVTDVANPDRERVLSHRTALSQGEQRVVSYLVLFATAAAHFSSIGRGAPAAPRLILLDDAFAKVDEPTHGRLLGLLVELDLDFVITSERLWGCFATVPSLHIYECLRDPHARGVATVHFAWDGRRKRLVGI
ncbi:MAG: hypothetical protein JWN52_7708 [Actinomycetia bacterium]|nr:hypothetical protein [Actinomycetes bacterium]